MVTHGVGQSCAHYPSLPSAPLRGVSSGIMASSPGTGGFDPHPSKLFVLPTHSSTERAEENKSHNNPCTDLSTSLMRNCCQLVLGDTV